MILLPAPAQVAVSVWRRQARRGAWDAPFVTTLRVLPEPGEFLETLNGLVRVRHIGVSSVQPDEQYRIWGEIVTAPPR